MKKLLAALAFSVLAVSPSLVRAAEPFVLTQDALMSSLLSNIVTQNAIDWKVGDKQTYNVAASQFGKLGTMTKTVTKDEGTALWVRQNINLSIQKEVLDVLYNKADSKVLKMLRNGKEQQLPDDTIEIISQDYTDITVPAGTFKSIHIVAKSKQVSHLEVWANPRDTVMEGTLKQAVSTQGIDIVMELTSFTKM